MGKPLPQRVFYSLTDIQQLWGVTQSELRQWLAYGELTACVWLPLMIFYEVIEEAEGNRLVLTRNPIHKEGYMPVFPHHCRSLFSNEQTCLREFPNDEANGRYALPDTAEGFQIKFSDLLILHDERIRFETEHEVALPISPPSRLAGGPNPLDPTFRNICYQGKHYRFGDVQAAVLRLLYEATLAGTDWQNGKKLLESAGSRSFTVSNIFKRNKIWRQLVESDGRGLFRLNKKFLESIQCHR